MVTYWGNSKEIVVKSFGILSLLTVWSCFQFRSTRKNASDSNVWEGKLQYKVKAWGCSLYNLEAALDVPIAEAVILHIFYNVNITFSQCQLQMTILNWKEHGSDRSGITSYLFRSYYIYIYIYACLTSILRLSDGKMPLS